MRILEIHDIYKTFDRGRTHVLKDIRFSFEKGKIYALIGDSGSGKTTLFRLIAGLDTVDAGRIMINDRIVSDAGTLLPPNERKIGMVFQDLALFPHLTVMQNIAFGLAGDIEAEVGKMLELIDLKGYESRYPDQLSVGQQQRVAIARALVTKPEILLLDEPFSNLDETLKSSLRNKLRTVVKYLGITMAFITHDVRDALALAEEVMFLQNGEMLEKGDIRTVFDNPKSRYVQSIYENLRTSAENILSVMTPQV